MQSSIRFLKANRYRRQIGEVDSEMGYGVHSLLVQRGIAEFVTQLPVAAAAISEPTVNTEPFRERKPRRFHKEPE